MELRFGDILMSYITWLGERPSAKKYLQLYEQFFAKSPLRDLPAHEVPRGELLYFKQLYAKTPTHCSRAISLVKQSYNWARNTLREDTKNPIYDGPNPAQGISRHRSRKRSRAMDHTEIRDLLKAIPSLPIKYQAFFMTRLIVPGRITELCAMDRNYVNLIRGKWHKPVTKNGEEQYIYLATQVRPYLEALPVSGRYFFQGAYGRPLQPGSAAKTWRTVRAALGLSDLQLLDFRRTLATFLYNEIKADELTIKAVLCHYDGRPIAIYTKVNYDKLADILQRYANWVWQFMPEDDAVQTALSFHEVTIQPSPSLPNGLLERHAAQGRAVSARVVRARP